MGLFGSAGNFAAQVLVEYKGDTKDLTKKMKGLKGEEKKLAKTRKAAMEESNKGIQGNISMIGRATIAVGAMGAAWYGASKAMALWAKDSQLRAAAAGVSIDALRKASHGLLSEQQLLKVAAAALNGQFQGTEKELEAVVGGIAQLSHEGNDLNQLVNVLAKSLAENGVEELQQFGISVRDATGAIAVKGTQASRETLLGAMEELDKKFKTIDSDAAVKSLNEVADATHNLGVEFGKLSNTVADALLNISENAQELILQLGQGRKGAGLNMFGKVLDFAGGGRASYVYEQATKQRTAKRERTAEERREQRIHDYWWAGLTEEQREAIRQGGMRASDFREYQEEEIARAQRIGIKGLGPTAAKRGGAGQGQADILAGLMKGTYEGAVVGGLPFPDIFAPSAAAPPTGLAPDWVEKNVGDVEQMMADFDKQIAGFRREEEVSFLEGIFGPVEEFDLYKSAFETLASGMNIAFDAWLAGADIGEALMKGLKEQGKLLAKELWMQATSHAAWAIGEAAFQRWPKAAMHAKAALAFGGAALAVGGVVRGGGGGGSIGTAAGTYGGGGAASQPQRPLVMVFAGDYAADRQEAGARAFEAMQSYKRRNGESDIVVDG